MDSKLPSPQSARAKPTTTKPGGSRPRLARSYTAGMSFFRDRSPVTPKITRAQGSGIRGSRRSCAVRSGLPTFPSCQFWRAHSGLSSGQAAGGRWRLRGLEGLGDVLEQLFPALLELLHALVLEDLEHVGDV